MTAFVKVVAKPSATLSVQVEPAKTLTVMTPGTQGPPGPPGPPADPVDGGVALQAHVADTTPHPSYDDLPSLALLFENGLI